MIKLTHAHTTQSVIQPSFIDSFVMQIESSIICDSTPLNEADVLLWTKIKQYLSCEVMRKVSKLYGNRIPRAQLMTSQVHKILLAHLARRLKHQYFKDDVGNIYWSSAFSRHPSETILSKTQWCREALWWPKTQKAAFLNWGAASYLEPMKELASVTSYPAVSNIWRRH